MAVLIIDCYIELFGTGICRFCIWVELPVQRRLYPIFLRNVESPDIHECFRGLTGCQLIPGFWGVTLVERALSLPNNHNSKGTLVVAILMKDVRFKFF